MCHKPNRNRLENYLRMKRLCWLFSASLVQVYRSNNISCLVKILLLSLPERNFSKFTTIRHPNAAKNGRPLRINVEITSIFRFCGDWRFFDVANRFGISLFKDEQKEIPKTHPWNCFARFFESIEPCYFASFAFLKYFWCDCLYLWGFKHFKRLINYKYYFL